MDYGFAKLDENFSTHYTEKEVLFNAMNLFKILKVSEENILLKATKGQEYKENIYVDVIVVELQYKTVTFVYEKFFNSIPLTKEE